MYSPPLCRHFSTFALKIAIALPSSSSPLELSCHSRIVFITELNWLTAGVVREELLLIAVSDYLDEVFCQQKLLNYDSALHKECTSGASSSDPFPYKRSARAFPTTPLQSGNKPFSGMTSGSNLLSLLFGRKAIQREQRT